VALHLLYNYKSYSTHRSVYVKVAMGVLTVASGAFRLQKALLSWLISEGESAFSEHGT